MFMYFEMMDRGNVLGRFQLWYFGGKFQISSLPMKISLFLAFQEIVDATSSKPGLRTKQPMLWVSDHRSDFEINKIFSDDGICDLRPRNVIGSFINGLG